MEREVYMVHRESARGGVEASAHARRAMRELARAVENGWAPHAQFSQKPESCNGVRESGPGSSQGRRISQSEEEEEEEEEVCSFEFFLTKKLSSERVFGYLEFVDTSTPYTMAYSPVVRTKKKTSRLLAGGYFRPY